MSISSFLYRLAERSHAHLTHYVLPLGWLLLLTGMFWLGNRSLYHQVFYIFLAFPSLLALILRPGLLLPLMRHPIFIAFTLFATYMMVTLAWSDTPNDTASLIKRPFYIAIFLLGTGLIALNDAQKLERVLRIAGLIAVLSAICSLVYFLYELWFADGKNRLPGYGILSNPLLTAHIYGAFAAYWLARWFLAEHGQHRGPLACLAVLSLLLLATGSRTPFLGLGMALLWLALAINPRRAMYGICAGAVIVLAQYALSSTMNIWAGVSYRPAIWMNTIQQISTAPWFGHGYDSPINVIIPELTETLFDPHNIELGILYAGGITGFILWAGVYASALSFAWKYRREQSVLIASTLLIFGFGSGLTEGAAFLSRPKEHWFLIWIPVALLFASSLVYKKKEQRDVFPEKTRTKITQGLEAALRQTQRT
jgi:O-antigen ligase